MRRGWLAEVDGRWTLRVGLAALGVTVPEGLRQMLEQQLDRLSPMEQRVLEVGAWPGPPFRPRPWLRASDTRWSRWRSGAATWPGGGNGCSGRRTELADGTVAGGYRFTHALYQEVAYTRLTAAGAAASRASASARRRAMGRRHGRWPPSWRCISPAWTRCLACRPLSPLRRGECPAAQCLSGSDHPSHHGAGGAGDAPRDPEAGPAGT